jgi:type III secretion protein Q
VPLPFDLPALSRGFAALTPAARATGSRVAESAAAALSALLGRAVAIRARACPGIPAARAVAARVALELAALPAAACLEVDPALVVAVVADLAGGPPATSPRISSAPRSGAGEGAATALTPVEGAALELFALSALEGACAVAGVEEALAPRLARAAGAVPSALSVELEIAAGPATGRARLLLPAAAVHALRGLAGEGLALGTRLLASVRSGGAPLAPEELDALAPGDVVLLDPPGSCPDALVLPGGARIAGRLADGALHVEEVDVNARTAQLPVRLEIELARVEILLAELARLEPGAALPLALDRRGLVTLRVGERILGRGELVDVDGAPGVRVLSLEGVPAARSSGGDAP